jgi:integration host factor subunit beta
MTKADLVEQIADDVVLSKKDSEIVVNTVFRCIIDALAEGDKVELRGFGSFRTRDRKSRVGRNPKTGDRVDVPDKKVPFFKPGKNLKKLVNGE